MLVRLNISWPIRQIKTMIEKGNINFDIYFQRNDAWNDLQRSKLIQTILEGYPVPPVYANKVSSTKVFEMMDGKQRMTAIFRFLNDQFRLSDGIIINDDGEEIDLSGKKYSELSEDMRNVIRDYNLTIYYYEDLTEEQQLILFDRLNGGTALTTYQKARAQCPAIKDVTELSKHAVFEDNFTSKAINSMKNEHQVVKSYIMLNEANPCLDRNYVEKTMEQLTLEESDKEMLTKVFDRINQAHTLIKTDDNDPVLNRKIARRIMSLVHFATIVPLTYTSIEDGVAIEDYVEFLQCFFGNEGKGASISEVYNANCLSGAGHRASVVARLGEINKEWATFNKRHTKMAEAKSA